MKKVALNCPLCAFAFKAPLQIPCHEKNFRAEIPRTAYFLDILDLGILSDTLKAENRYYLLAICAASNYIIVFPMKNRSTPEVKNAILNGIITHFGAPLQLCFDNESSFKSHELMHIYSLYGIKPHFISPHAPQGNKAENGIKLFKKLLRPSIHAFSNWPLIVPLLVHSLNNIPSSKTSLSPEQIFFHSVIGPPHQSLRCIRTHKYNSDACHKLIKDFLFAHQRLAETSEAERRRFNKNRKRRYLIPGQLVTVRNVQLDGSRSVRLSNWGPFVVVNKNAGNTYDIRHIGTGRLYKRHRLHLFPLLEGQEQPFLQPSWDTRIKDLAYKCHECSHGSSPEKNHFCRFFQPIVRNSASPDVSESGRERENTERENVPSFSDRSISPPPSLSRVSNERENAQARERPANHVSRGEKDLISLPLAASPALMNQEDTEKGDDLHGSVVNVACSPSHAHIGKSILSPSHLDRASTENGTQSISRPTPSHQTDDPRTHLRDRNKLKLPVRYR